MPKYVAVAEIGRGGFGVVERVRDSQNKSYARKTFSPASHIPLQVHEKLRKRFTREVMIQAQLGGAEIMPVLDSNLIGDNPWFVMPLADKTYELQIAQERKSFTTRVGTYKKYDPSPGTYCDCYNLEFPGDLHFLDREPVAC